MSKRKAGLPQGFSFDLEKPDGNEKPIRVGDYLDDIDGGAGSLSVLTQTRQNEAPRTPDPVVEEIPKASRVSPVKRARLNVSMGGRKRLSDILKLMAKYGPEEDVHASEVLEAMILALHDAREHLDLGNVRRRGKYGSPSHRQFPIALAESVGRAIANSETARLL